MYVLTEDWNNVCKLPTPKYIRGWRITKSSRGFQISRKLISYINKRGDMKKEIENRISATSTAFGQLYHRVWKSHELTLKTKLSIYETIVISTLLYSVECWTTLKEHLTKLNSFHMRCLRTTLKISWRDYIPNEIILERSNMLNIEDLVQNRRLRWLGHVSRMQEDRLPHKIAFSELKSGQRARCKPKRR